MFNFSKLIQGHIAARGSSSLAPSVRKGRSEATRETFLDDFAIELKTGFLEEAEQLLIDAEKCFLLLEKTPDDLEVINQIFRQVHNIKGSAAAVGFRDIGEFAHTFESLLLKFKNREMKLDKQVLGLLLRCNDCLSSGVSALKGDMDSQLNDRGLIAELNQYLSGAVVTESSSQPITQNVVGTALAPAVDGLEFLPDSIDKAPLADRFSDLETLTRQSLSEVNGPAPAPVIELPTAKSREPRSPAYGHNVSDESIRVSLGRLDGLIDFVGELVILQTVINQQTQDSSSILLRDTVNRMAKAVKEIQDVAMGLRMLPLKQTFQKMQRIVRDTAAQLGKEVHLTVTGEETELDKTVLEHLGDPLVHLIRNAVDHGIESAELRKAAAKDAAGQIHLHAFHRSGSIVIEVKDDGGGIHVDRIKAKAIEKGILSPSAVLSDQEAYQLIFHPGLSTKAVATDVSGRGVGMDVVKTNVEKLKGSIQIESWPGKGTLFRVKLPLTLSIIEGMVVTMGAERFVLPLTQIHESIRPTVKDISTTSGLGQVMMLRGEALSLYTIDSLLSRKANLVRAPWESIAIVIRSGEKPFAIQVDDILGQLQVVVKKLGPEIQVTPGITGSAILGDGRPALILEPSELLARSRGVKAA